MKNLALVILTLLIGAQLSYAQENAVAKTIKKLSQDKWDWMAEKKTAPLDAKSQQLIQIAALTAAGNLELLKPALVKGLDAGLSVNQIKEAIIHLYAYAGFPRSIRGLQTFMALVAERQKQGVYDEIGKAATEIKDARSKYERGKAILQSLTGKVEPIQKSGYAAFEPQIEILLKEHLFADLFERDVLSFIERELITISVIASIGAAEPMLKSHLTICLNLGLTAPQLQDFVDIITATVGVEKGQSAQQVLDQLVQPK